MANGLRYSWRRESRIYRACGVAAVNGCPVHARHALTKFARAQVNSDFYRAFSTKNISLMGTVWHKSPHVQCIHPGAKPLVGYDNIVSMWSNMFQVTCARGALAWHTEEGIMMDDA